MFQLSSCPCNAASIPWNLDPQLGCVNIQITHKFQNSDEVHDLGETSDLSFFEQPFPNYIFGLPHLVDSPTLSWENGHRNPWLEIVVRLLALLEFDRFLSRGSSGVLRISGPVWLSWYSRTGSSYWCVFFLFCTLTCYILPFPRVRIPAVGNLQFIRNPILNLNGHIFASRQWRQLESPHLHYIYVYYNFISIKLFKLISVLSRVLLSIV